MNTFAVLNQRSSPCRWCFAWDDAACYLHVGFEAWNDGKR